MACPVGVFTFSSAMRSLPVLAFGTISFIGVMTGRLVCSFFCPFGLLQELLFRIPFRKIHFPRFFRYFKYAALVLLVFFLPFFLGYDKSTELNLYFCKICPNGTLTATLPAYFSELKNSPVSAWSSSPHFRLGVLFLFLILMVLVSRPFCRSLCPLGAIYALFSRFAFYRIRVEPSLCVSCRLCRKVCPVDLHVEKEAGNSECVACGECIKTCPHGAIKEKLGWA